MVAMLLLLCIGVDAATAKKVLPKRVGKSKKQLLVVHRQAPVPVDLAARQSAVELASHGKGHLENAAALVPFFERLYQAQESRGPIHILQFGDSHTASDDWANAVRLTLRAKAGNGGPGFTLAGHPFAGYRRFDVRGGGTAGWVTSGLVQRPSDGRNGLGGVSVTAQGAGQCVWLQADSAEIAVHYWQQPGGGMFRLSAEGSPISTISTAGEPGLKIVRYQAAMPGPQRYQIETVDAGPVRLFGWVSENQSGLTYETLGINGARMEHAAQWEAEQFGQSVAARDPALIVVAYGTNEGIQRDWTAVEYRTLLTTFLTRLRQAAPAASILLVGPPDCAFRSPGRWVTYPHLDSVITIQREVARLSGCAFYDWRALMGGPGAVGQWVRAGLSQPDHVHLTATGYRLLGSTLGEELLEQYSRFAAVRME